MDVYYLRGEAFKLFVRKDCILIIAVVLRLVKRRLYTVVKQEKLHNKLDVIGGGASQDGYPCISKVST